MSANIHRNSVILGALAMAVGLAAAPPAWQTALDRITADSLRGHLSFLASDLLEGRDTPSRGLDIAAEYIAAQFRRAGLEPGGGDGYFQTANMLEVQPNLDGFDLKLEREKRVISVPREKVTIRTPRELNLSGVPVCWAAPGDLSKLSRDEVRGKALATESPGRGTLREIMSAVRALEPAVVFYVTRGASMLAPGRRALVDPDDRATAGGLSLTIRDAALLDTLSALKPGPTEWTVTLRLPPPVEKPVKARNVVGILRGSDAALKDTCVLLTAHYDHLGVVPTGEGDRIYNGANDDASGTVSVIEIAAALAKLPQRPSRTIVFATFFGEEKGSLGAQYYTRHPVCPLEKTVADVNLEQLGRTDASDGAHVSDATFTGYEFTDLAGMFQEAGERTGVRVYNSTDSDDYYPRSDNQTFANRGIPASTVCVAYIYPDYHAVGDEWNKIDYDNMARVDRMLALGTLLLADSEQAPKWNESNAKTARYVEAWRKLHPAMAPATH